MVDIADVRNIPLRKVRSLVYSKENYKKLTKMIAEEAIYPPQQDEIHLQHLTPESKKIIRHIYTTVSLTRRKYSKFSKLYCKD